MNEIQLTDAINNLSIQVATLRGAVVQLSNAIDGKDGNPGLRSFLLKLTEAINKLAEK
jgi:hypothetical protein